MACTREDVEEIFSSADKDKSGLLNIRQEFCHFVFKSDTMTPITYIHREFRDSRKAVSMVKEAESSHTGSGSQSPAQRRFEHLVNY